MAQSPMLQMIPYSSSFNLYRFPPTTPGLGLLIGSLFTADVLPGHQEEPLDPRTADADQLKRAGQGWLTITRTKEEVSIMLDADYPASDVGAKLDELVHAPGSQGVKDGPFGCLRIRGPMELGKSRLGLRVLESSRPVPPGSVDRLPVHADLVGIASRMLAPLTRAAISVLVISS